MSLDLSTVDHHPALEEIVDILCSKTQNTDRGFFRTEVAYFMGKMASTMRATIQTKDRGEMPVNIYALALATSGYGKGHSVGIMEEEFLKGFKTRFMEDTFPVVADQNLWVIANSRAARNGTDQQEEYDKAAKEFRQAGAYPFTFDSGTPPAVKQLRQKLLMATCGSVNLQIDEIGSNLLQNAELLILFLELYDQGLVKQKLTKNTAENQRAEDMEGKTPTNMLLFGTPSKLFDGSKTEEEFYSFLETGYARRCLFGYGVQNSRAHQNQTAEEVFKSLTQTGVDAAVTKWARHFYTLADPAVFGWKMEVPDSVSIAALAYRIECEKQAEKMADHEEIKKAELSHRYMKALKLAGAYAFVDGSTEILMEHLSSAIKLVEESGAAFQTILNREKTYVKLAKYIAGIGTEVTHADLHEALPFYKSSQAARNEMMTLATAWGYKKHIIIKKSFADGIELFKGETLKETDLDKIVVSYSNHWAYNYLPEEVPFDKLHILTQTADFHWANHHFKGGHRSEENVLAGFNMIAIDVDGGASLHQAHELMKEFKFLTYTTKRHCDEENRFRLMMPINYRLELDHDEYKEFMNNIMDWLPFATDESANQRAKKWESFAGGQHHYNLEGEILDVLNFIPKTSRNELYKKSSQDLGSLDNLERWFASRIATGNRNNQMIKYALCLVDAGWDLPAVQAQVHAFNKKLSDSMTEQEIDSTILVTVAKRFQQQNA
ncbi:primase C-terminal domain-containing protein [Mesorhizobium sp. M4B.F.Ca.ET.058.02.1.1]|uniref:primase C-terminal domain-containing protein n=1 Tax=Mesorhizobium sp. M4B.F.Ca.ET.058.02.1.1 TaxID=2493675 RepID=UPI000F75EC53|nr:primase C-terminal domain-containing protein [Mesorhizobium sp. M4B.F.Ca.ET.058.02.1.1]AZO48033.1 DUF3987 domain-containing protein [Mesorhizobium sp. M4B.F.Ca.ET.058.02.1.1]